MPRGKLKYSDEKCIQKNYVYIKEQIEALDLVDYLYQVGLLSLNDKEQIYKGQTKLQRNEDLLSALLNGGPGEAFNNFLQSLEEKYPHVLERLRETGQQNTKEDYTRVETLEVDDATVTEKVITLQMEIIQLQKQNAVLGIENCQLKEEKAVYEFVRTDQEDEIITLQNEKARLIETLSTKEQEIMQLKQDNGLLKYKTRDGNHTEKIRAQNLEFAKVEFPNQCLKQHALYEWRKRTRKTQLLRWHERGLL